MAIGHLFPSNGGGYGDRETFARMPSGSVMARVLAAGVAETVTIPSGANLVVFSANADFYASPVAAPAVPAADVTDGSAPELNPACWALEGLASLYLVAPAAGIVTLAFYR